MINQVGREIPDELLAQYGKKGFEGFLRAGQCALPQGGSHRARRGGPENRIKWSPPSGRRWKNVG